MRIKYIIAVAFLVRLIFIAISNDEFNMWTLTAFASFALKGYNPWLASFHLGFRGATESTPLMVLLVMGVQLFEKSFSFPSYISFKMMMVFSDVLSTCFFYKIALILSKEKKISERVTMLFSLNPLLIFVSSITIIDDSIVILFTILALYFFLRYSSSEPQLPETLMLSAFFLGLGISFKFYPLFLIPAFIVKMRKIKEMLIFLFFSCLPFLVVSLPFILWDSTSYYLSFFRYVAVPPTIVNLIDTRVRQPVAGFSVWWVILDLIEIETSELMWLLNQTAMISLAVAFIIMSYFTRKKNPSIIVNINLLLLTVYLFYFRMSTHYIAWIIPFAYLLNVNSSKSKSFAQLIPIVLSVPVLVYYMLVAGQYGTSGGRQLYPHGGGIYNFFYPIFKSDVLTWRALNLDWFSILRITTFVILTMNIYFLAKLSSEIKSESNRKIINFSPIKKVLKTLRRHFLVLLFLVVILPYTIGPNVYTTSDFGNSASAFFDTFESESLSFDWYWAGEGTYKMRPRGNPSNILLDSQGLGKRSFIYQFVYYLIPPHVYSVQGSIEVRFQTEELSENAQTQFLFNLDHGWLSAEKVFKETSPKVLFDRYLQYSWAPIALGLGGLGVPTLEYDSYDMEKISAMRVDISNGTFLQSGVERSFENSQDWTEYNYLFMDIFGNKTWTTTWLSIHSPDAANARTYFFVDTWEGWRTLIFPLKQSQPLDAGNPDFSKVKEILILWQSLGNFSISRIGIDRDLNYNFRYNYVDSMASKGYILQEYLFTEKDFSWHTFKITCNSTGRHVYFDGVLKLSIETNEEKTFSYVILGNFDQDPCAGGSVAVDWVDIKIDSLKKDLLGLSLAFGLPLAATIVIGAILFYRIKKKQEQNTKTSL